MKKRLKIGYIMQSDAADMSTVSGPQLHVKAVVDGFKKLGHHVRVVAIQQGEVQWTDDLVNWYPGEFGMSESAPFRLVEKPVRFVQGRLELPFFRLFDSYRFSDACAFAVNGYDVLYERDSAISYGGLIAARRLGIPNVLEVNGDLVEEWEHLGLEFSRGQRAAVHFVTRQLYRHASHIVAVGETIKKRLIDRWGLDPSHISVVTNGAAVDLFLDTDLTSDVRKRYPIGDGPVIIFVGGFQPWHGVDLILEGFRQAEPAVPESRMIFVGDGPLRSDLEKKVNSLGLRERVVFTGRVDHRDVAQLLRIADVAVIYHRASAAEIVETPLKLFEYMAAGKAIVAPDVPNMRRVLTDRANALLIPPDSPQALARALVELIDDRELRDSLGRAARKEAVERHSWDRAVSELESLLYGLLEKQQKNKSLTANSLRDVGAEE